MPVQPPESPPATAPLGPEDLLPTIQSRPSEVTSAEVARLAASVLSITPERLATDLPRYAEIMRRLAGSALTQRPATLAGPTNFPPPKRGSPAARHPAGTPPVGDYPSVVTHSVCSHDVSVSHPVAKRLATAEQTGLPALTQLYCAFCNLYRPIDEFRWLDGEPVDPDHDEVLAPEIPKPAVD